MVRITHILRKISSGELFGVIVLLLVMITAFLLILPIFLVVVLLVTVVSIPHFLGGKLSLEASVIKGLDRVIGLDTMRYVRDDLMITFYPYLNRGDFDSFDKWYLYRSIETGRETVLKRLRAGESVLAFIAGVVSILIITSTTYNFYLSIFLMLLLISVTVRIAAINVLAFRSRDHPHASTRDLEVMVRWNNGPVKQRGMIQMVFLTLVIGLVAKPDSDRYNMAMDVVGRFVAFKSNGNYYKWHSNREIK